MLSSRSENGVIQEFIGNNENTMNSVVSASVGTALLKLRDNYLAEAPSDDDIANLWSVCFSELNNFLQNEHYQAYFRAIRYIMRTVDEPKNELDSLAIYRGKKNGEQVSETYIIPLKEVLALVWAGITDNNAYMHHYEGSKAEQRRQAQNDFPERLTSFLNCLKELHRNPVCHHGTRNELVFCLNGTYNGIHILENDRTAIHSYLTDALVEHMTKVMTENASKENPSLMKAVTSWMSKSDARKFLKLIDPEGEIKAGLSAMFVSHGISPKDITLEKKINEALAYLEFSCDPKQFPVSAAASELLKEIPDRNQPERNEALALMQEKLVNGCFSEEDIDIYAFYQAYNAHKEIFKNRDLLTLSGEMTIEKYDAFSRWLLDILKTSSFVFSENDKTKLERFNDRLQLAKRDALKDVVENYFVDWFSALENDDIDAHKRLYEILLAEDLNQKIILSDDLIRQFQARATDEGVVDMTPYMINRLFLHAILVSPHEWTEMFASLFERTLAFVKNQFDQNEIEETANGLQRDSYPEVLLDQLTYLLKQNQEESFENNLRPEEMLLLPGQAKNAREWGRVLSVLEEARISGVLQAYAIQIKTVIKEFNDLEIMLEGIHIDYRITLINVLGDKIKKIITNGDDLDFCLSGLDEAGQEKLICAMSEGMTEGRQLVDLFKGLSETHQRSLIDALGQNKLSMIIEDGDQLSSCLLYLSTKNKIRLTNSLISIRNIIKNGNQLARCLEQFSEENRINLIKRTYVATGRDISKVIKDGDQLARCLKQFSEKSQMGVIKLLGENIKEIIEDDQQLASCFEVMLEKNKLELAEILGDKICNKFLYLAAEHGEKIVIDVLLFIPGINLKDTSNKGKTLSEIFKENYSETSHSKYIFEYLSKAIKAGNSSLFKLMAKASKFDLNKKDSIGRTLLHIAAEDGQTDIVKYILSYDNINLTTYCNGHDLAYLNGFYFDMSPLHLAIKKGHVAAVKALLAKEGIDPLLESGWLRLTPFDLALKIKNGDIINAFLDSENLNIKEVFKQEDRYLNKILALASRRFNISLCQRKISAYITELESQPKESRSGHINLGLFSISHGLTVDQKLKTAREFHRFLEANHDFHSGSMPEKFRDDEIISKLFDISQRKDAVKDDFYNGSMARTFRSDETMNIMAGYLLLRQNEKRADKAKYRGTILESDSDSDSYSSSSSSSSYESDSDSYSSSY